LLHYKQKNNKKPTPTMAELPSSVGLPQEMMLVHLDYSLPPDARSMSIKTLPSNINTYTTTFSPALSSTISAFSGDIAIASQNIIFDLPCGGSPSQFLDTRFTTLNFQSTLAFTNIGTTGVLGTAFQRGGGYSWFDRMYITSSSGQVIEDIVEVGLVNDTLVNLQFNHSVRAGVATQYGFNPTGGDVLSQGHPWAILQAANTSPSTSQSETHSYSIPLSSAVIGVLADKFLNVGRTSKLQLVLQISSVLPITIQVGTTAYTVPPVITATLSNFSLQMEYVDIGINALQMLDSTLVDGKSYIHGTTYRTTSSTLTSSTGFTSLLAGLRASSVKSLFCRFVANAAPNTANGINGKYSSFNPLLNLIQFNVGGVKYPQTGINPLLQPSQSARELQMAVGSFNNSMFQSSISPAQYCRLAAGGTAQGLVSGAVQEYSWNVGSDIANAQSLFIFGENMEVCARRGLLSGLNCTSAPIFVEMNSSAAPTNNHTVYTIAMIDQVLIHDVRSGDIQVRV